MAACALSLGLTWVPLVTIRTVLFSICYFLARLQLAANKYFLFLAAQWLMNMTACESAGRHTTATTLAMLACSSTPAPGLPRPAISLLLACPTPSPCPPAPSPPHPAPVCLGTTIAVLTPSPTAAAAIQAAVIVLLVTTNGFLAPPPPAYLKWVYESSYLGFGAPVVLAWAGLRCARACAGGSQPCIASRRRQPATASPSPAAPPLQPSSLGKEVFPHCPAPPCPAGYDALTTNEFSGLTLTAAAGTQVTLAGPPPDRTPHSSWSLGAIMGMQAGQWAAFWVVMYLAMALVARLRRL